MILSDKTIERLLAEGSLRIAPLEPGQVQPASVDLRLGTTFLAPRPKEGMFSLDEPIEYERIEGESFIIPTHGFVLLRKILCWVALAACLPVSLRTWPRNIPRPARSSRGTPFKGGLRYCNDKLYKLVDGPPLKGAARNERGMFFPA